MTTNNFQAHFLAMGDTSVSTYLLEHYQALGMTNDEFLLFIQLKNQIEHQSEVDLSKISNIIGWSIDKINQLIEQMRTKGFIELISGRDAQGKVATSIDFTPLYQKIFETKGVYNASTAGQRVESAGAVLAETAAKNDQPTRTDIYNLIEQEFGRPLSSMELETVKGWFDIDHFRPDFIKAALQEAVMNGALSLRYIETILVSWQKKNYHSLNDIYNERKNRQQFKQASPDVLPEIPTDINLYNLDIDKLN